MTGSTWPVQLSGNATSIREVTEGGTLSSAMQNSIDTFSGAISAQTQALHMDVLQKINGAIQDPPLIEPAAAQAGQMPGQSSKPAKSHT